MEIDRDGDIWEHFYSAAKAKGPSSIRLTWIKGHSTQHHIDEGISAHTHKAGNDEADITADIGTALYGQEVIVIARHLYN